MTYPNVTFPQYGLVDDAIARHFRRSYWAAVSQMDQNVGLLLDELEALGLANSTVVLFAGDHGWQLGDLGEFGKKTNFERATRAPLIIRDPIAYRSGKSSGRSTSLVEFVDIYATLIDLALGSDYVPKVCPSDSTYVDICTEGRTLRPIMENQKTSSVDRPAVFMQYAHCMHDDKVWHDACANTSEPHVMGYAVRTRRWRYVEWVKFDKKLTQPLWDEVLGTELYDHTEKNIVENVAESVNVVNKKEFKQVVNELSKLLRQGWRGAISGGEQQVPTNKQSEKSTETRQRSFVTIDNTKPRLDIHGKIMNAHDGTYRKYGDYWYYHAMEYGICREPMKYGCTQTPDHCGFRDNHNVSIWRSRNLSSGSWEKIGNAMECQKLEGCALAYRPHLVYNPKTKKYVLFVNYVGTGHAYKGYAVYSSESPAGPFHLENNVLNVSRLCPGPIASAPCGKAQAGCGKYIQMSNAPSLL